VHVEITSRPLPGGGHVVAIDDLTPLMEAQRQAAWSEVAQRVAHEIRNPLTPIQLAAERIQKRAGALDGEMRAIVSSGCDAIVAQVSGLKELVDAFQDFARMPAIAPQPTDLDRMVRELCSLYDGVRPGLDVASELSPPQIRAKVDPVLLRQALVNLLDNAVAAIVGDGRVVITARTVRDDLVIEVEDSGVGFPTEDREVLLEPFFSTKGRGSGMGLAMVHRVVTEHGGTLELENLHPAGARVRITLNGVLL
jgi:nitrogen fixation/metabolism regulation signal transduction histidine kinase